MVTSGSDHPCPSECSCPVPAPYWSDGLTGFSRLAVSIQRSENNDQFLRCFTGWKPYQGLATTIISQSCRLRQRQYSLFDTASVTAAAPFRRQVFFLFFSISDVVVMPVSFLAVNT
jgi:hypothetical protein